MKLSPHVLTAPLFESCYSEFDSCQRISPPYTNQCSTCRVAVERYT